jgi:hypothetical protein
MKIIFIIAFLFLGFSQSSVVVTDITATGDIDSQLCNASLCSLKNEFNCMKGSIDTLYVDQGYNCTDGIHFNTISAAMVKAATLVPTADNLVTILINPGTYTENVQVVSNTVMQGIYQSTFICGDVTWFASVGVNVMYSTQDEYIFMNNLILASDQNYDVVCGSLIISTVDKTDMSSYTEAILVLVFVLDITSVTMRNSDELEFQSCEFFDTVSLYNVGVTLFTDTSFDNVYFLAGTIGVVQNCYFNSIYVQDSPFTELYFAIVLENATFINSIITAGQSIFSNVVVTSSSQASILDCTFTKLIADNTSQVDRDKAIFTVIPPNRGENSFIFPIAYINAPSYIGISQRTGGSTEFEIVSISNTDFVYTVTFGGSYVINVQNYVGQEILI